MLITSLKLIVLVILCYLVHRNYARTSNLLRITLPNGSKLVGKYQTSLYGKGIRAFLGIPYAKPPIGDLRFRAPIPAAPWKGEKDATNLSEYCLQRQPFSRDHDVIGNEDCLYLNVFSPQKVRDNKLLSVMVWFHGGGFIQGSANFYDPDFLLDHDIVYVAANYRLGPLGFLSTGQEDCPGNFGLKDQVLVLKWVQENIHVFGGNSSSVTIFGESAGGASVTYLMASPLTKGLIHRAIAQSGTYFNPWAQPAHNGVETMRAAKLGDIVGCPLEDSDWLKFIKCLRKTSGFNITEAFYDFYEWDIDPMVAFPPVVEVDLPGAFLTEHPRTIEHIHTNTIPFLAGLNLDEGLMKTSTIYGDPEMYKDVQENKDSIFPIALYYHHLPKDVQTTITKKINKFYFGNEPELTEKLNQNLTNIFSDGWFNAGIDLYIKNRLLGPENESAGPTYVYLYAHKGEASITELFRADPETYYGVSHADELLSLFPFRKFMSPKTVPSMLDTVISKTLVAYWVNFANFGDPTPNIRDEPKWIPATTYPLDYLRIGIAQDINSSIVAMEKGLLENRINFWHKLGAHLSAQSSVDPSSSNPKEEL